MKSLRLLEPLPYLDFVRLMERAAVLTDSGGIQEETTALGVPCLTLRPSTERPITTTRGTNTAVGVDPCRIAAAWKRTLAEVKRVLRRRGTVGMTTWAEDPATPAGQIWDEELLAAQHRESSAISSPSAKLIWDARRGSPLQAVHGYRRNRLAGVRVCDVRLPLEPTTQDRSPRSAKPTACQTPNRGASMRRRGLHSPDHAPSRRRAADHAGSVRRHRSRPGPGHLPLPWLAVISRNFASLSEASVRLSVSFR